MISEPDSTSVHNAVFLLVQMYGRLLAQQQREIDLLKAELQRAHASKESFARREAVPGPPPAASAEKPF